MTDTMAVEGGTMKSEGSTPKEFIVLRVRYVPEALFDEKEEQALRTQMLERYAQQRKTVKDQPSCVVEILPDKADSGVVRGLHALWSKVHEEENGDVVVARFPERYIDALAASGLQDMPGFHLAYSAADAVRLLAGQKQAAPPPPPSAGPVPHARRKNWWSWGR